MKQIFFTFILVSGLAFAASAQSNNESAVQVQTAGQTLTESAATPEQPAPAAQVNENGTPKTDCGVKTTSEATGTKKACCAHGKKSSSANCGSAKSEAKSEAKKDEKISE